MKPKNLPSTATGRKRLLQLADMLDADAKDKKGLKFDYNHWGQVDFEYVHDDEDNEDNVVLEGEPGLNCHTAACALGLAAISGKFEDLGFKMRKDSNDIIILYQGKDWGPVEAAEKVFDLTYDEAYTLFVDGLDVINDVIGARAERAVAKLLRRFVAGKDIGIEYPQSSIRRRRFRLFQASRD